MWDFKHPPFYLFSEIEKAQYLARLIEGDGCFTKYELLITEIDTIVFLWKILFWV